MTNERDQPKDGDVAIPVLPAPIRAECPPAGFVVDGTDPATGDRAITVNAADGSRSTTRLAEDGSVSLNVERAGKVGRPGEPRVIRTLRQRLQTDGHAVSLETGNDDRGEDARLTIDGKSYVLQIVTAPGDPSMWQHAKAGVGTSVVNHPRAVYWLRAAINTKARKTTQREKTVLALDAQHAGILTEGHIIGAYLERFGTPRVEFGFSAVWVVGPTVSRCARIGD